MSLYLAHGNSIEEIEKYDLVASSKNVSIAEYFYSEGKDMMHPFTHSHKEYEFLMPLETIPLLRYEKAIYIGEVGNCYPIEPFVPHGIEFDLQSHTISIVISNELIDKEKKRQGFEGRYFNTKFFIRKELLLLVQKFQEEASKDYPNELIINHIENLLARVLVHDGLVKDVDNRRPEKVYAKNIKNVLEYIFNNYDNPELSVLELAEVCGCSVAHFSRSFKAFVGDPPIVHINKLRLSKAKALFGNKDLSLGEIAKMCGYNNISTFTESFKKIIGMKPKEYREKFY